MKYSLLKFSLLSTFVMLCAGFVHAADEPEITIDFTGNTAWGIPTSGTNKDRASFTNGTYTIQLYATNNYKMNNGYLILGKKDSYLELPAFDFDVEKIEVVGNSAASASVKQNIYVGEEAVSSETTGATETNTYEIDDAYQAAGNIYKLMVTSNHNTQITYVKVYKKDTSDTRTATTLTLGDHATSGTVGTTMNLPTATVQTADGAPVESAAITWTSSNEEVATIGTAAPAINLLKAGTTVIKAQFEGDNSYQPSSASFTLTVMAAPYTSFAALQADATTAAVPATIQFGGQQVVFVNGSNAFLADADGYGLLVYTNNHGLVAGDQLSGTASVNLTLYQGNTEVTGFSKDGLTITNAEVTPVVKTLADITKANQSTLVTLKGLTYSVGSSDKLLSDATGASIVYYDKFRTNTELEEGKTYDITGLVVLYNDKIEICPRTADDIVEGAAPVEPSFPITATWDFTNADVVDAVVALSGSSTAGTIASVENNGLLLTVEPNGQRIRNNDNSIQTGDGVVFKVPVQGKKDVVTVVGFSSPYFAYSVAGTDATDATTTYTATAADVAQGYVEVVNKGQYLISIKVVQNEDDSQGEEPVATDVTATWDWQNQIPASITTTNIQGADANGTVASDVEGVVLNVHAALAGTNIKLQYNASGYAQFNQNTCIEVPVKNADDVVTVVSYPGQAKYTVGGQDATGQNTFTYTATAADARKGYVEIVATGTAYLYSIKAELKAQQPAVVLKDEPVTATFPFNLGTAGQTATFSNADYFLSSKVNVGSSLTLDGKDNKSLNQTWFNPASKESAATDANAIEFIITPKPGFTFTPTKVSFQAARYATNDGKLAVAWRNADGTLLELAGEAAQPAREELTDYSYVLSSATAGEGACGLHVNMWGLNNSKHIGFSNIVIEGTLSGEEQEVPMLASFVINGTEYSADEVFGEQYEAALELSKTEAMVSANNPLTDVVAANGEVGTIAYEGSDEACKVTIPVTAGQTTMSYVLNVSFKPDFTLTYINTDGTTLGTQTVEKGQAIGAFTLSIDRATSTEGKKARGWFKNNYVGEKYSVADVVTADINLYAIETEVEVASDSRKYVFDLRDKFFYAEDHEAFNPVGRGAWHDTTHGWAFSNGDQLQLLVGPKASVLLTLCAYSAESNISVSNGETVAAKAATDGAIGSFNYEGEGGIITMTFGGTTYLHSVTILNTTTTNYDRQDNWFVVKKGDASSFVDALEAANGQGGTDRMFIFLPNGTYDLGQQTLTNIGRSNISIIGESQDGVTIKNTPTAEGIGVTATLFNTAQNTYMQDLTIQNAWDYYGGISSGAGAGRAVCLQDKGTNTIAKNVTLLSYQDTYYTNNADGQYYWETSDIHGTVDFLCGEGTLFVESSTITVEKRNPDGKGECTITAPSTKAGNRYGYVFNGCQIQNEAEKYNLGRAWNNEPRCAYINTTVNDAKINSKRWTTSGMNNNVLAKEFVEYGTQNGPASNVLEFVDKSGNVKSSYETILTAEQAAEFTVDKVFTGWSPATLAQQVSAPEAKAEGSQMTWTAVDGAIAYAVFKNDELVAITADNTLSVETAPADRLTIRSANSMGGFGQEAVVTVATGISESPVEAATADKAMYNLQGMRVKQPVKGLYIVGGKKVMKH